MYGELVPVGGGDPIPLLDKKLRIGRRESCDIVLRFPNISAYHCLLLIDQGYWFVKDLNSTNGVKVDGQKLPPDGRKRLDPGSELAIAKHKYQVQYSPTDLGAVGAPPADDERPDSFLSRSLLERAGLQRRDVEQEDDKDQEKEKEKRYNVLDDRAGRLPKSNVDPI